MVFHQPVAEFLMNWGALLVKVAEVALFGLSYWRLITTQHEHRRNGVTIGEVGEEVILDAIRRCG